MIYGDGYLKGELEKHIQWLGLLDSVELAGSVRNLEDRIYDSALFVLSSDFEGMPNALLEAMSLGLPVISTDASGGGPREVIRSGTNGILVPIRDKDAIANAMIEVLTDYEYGEKLASNAHRIVESMSPGVTLQKWESYISTVSGWS